MSIACSLFWELWFAKSDSLGWYLLTDRLSTHRTPRPGSLWPENDLCRHAWLLPPTFSLHPSCSFLPQRGHCHCYFSHLSCWHRKYKQRRRCCESVNLPHQPLCPAAGHDWFTSTFLSASGKIFILYICVIPILLNLSVMYLGGRTEEEEIISFRINQRTTTGNGKEKLITWLYSC